MFVTRTGLRVVLSYGIVSKCEKGIVNLYVFTYSTQKKSIKACVCSGVRIKKKKGDEKKGKNVVYVL